MEDEGTKQNENKTKGEEPYLQFPLAPGLLDVLVVGWISLLDLGP